MFYNPITIANYFIFKSFEEGLSMTPMKVLKLVYIANGWYLGYTGNTLITERSQAWQYGPVISTVYDAFKIYGRNEIEKIFVPSQYLQEDYQKLITDKYIVSFLDSVWNIYKKYNALELSDLTHQEGTPWSITYKSMGNRSTIPNDLIEQHYKDKIDANGGGRK
ncbi:SocA family protein [Elizabethkingia anophelis]|nr:SocA family protein [Elizabethkingia anophelis]MCT3724842.1 SocA family protein [Elizabethkingia anophelis]